MPVTTLPYPLPESWQLKAAKPLRWWAAGLWMLGAAGLGGAAVAALLREEGGRGAALTLAASAILLVVGVTGKHSGAERGAPHLVNAVALSTVRRRPPDSWVHFFRQSRPVRRLVVCFSASGILAVVTFGWCSVLSVRAGGSALWLLVVLVPLILGGALLAFTGIASGVIRWRHGSFGRRPMGISVGRHGIARYFLDDVRTWGWDEITEVRATVSAVDKTNGSFVPGLHVEHAEDEDGRVEDDYGLDDYEAHAWLIYTAIRFYLENPQHREELSTTFAQRRLTDWRDAMVVAATSLQSPARSARPWGSGRAAASE